MAARDAKPRAFSVLILPIKAGCLILAQFLPSFIAPNNNHSVEAAVCGQIVVKLVPFRHNGRFQAKGNLILAPKFRQLSQERIEYDGLALHAKMAKPTRILDERPPSNMPKQPAMKILSVVLAILARAMILLAFSEYVFLNEGPVVALLRAGDMAASLLHLAELTACYLLPAGVLFALEHRITGWATCLLVGAFVGWSIEGAVVPAVYEAPPISYFWTSISWHAPIDVWFGIVIMVGLISRPLTAKGLLGMVLAGVFWAIWASWTWPDLRLSTGEFAALATCVFGLLGAGYLIIRLTQRDLTCAKNLGRTLIGINLLAALAWASLAPIPALILAVVAAANVWVLRMAGGGDAKAVQGIPKIGSILGYLAVLTLAATLGYTVVVRFGTPISGVDLAAIAALVGLLLWIGAVVSVLRNAWRAP